MSEQWEIHINNLRKIVQEIGWQEACENDGKCSPDTLLAILHINQSRRELEIAIEALHRKNASEENRRIEKKIT